MAIKLTDTSKDSIKHIKESSK